MQTQTFTKLSLIGLLLFSLVVFTIAGPDSNKNMEFPNNSIFKKILNDFKTIIAKDLTRIGMTADLGFAGLETNENNINAAFLPPPPITVTSIEDAWLEEAAQDKNYGGAEKLSIENKNSDNKHIALKVDLSAYSCVVVESAKLYLYVTGGEGGGVVLNAHEIINEWDENNKDGANDEVSWHKRLHGTNWNTDGGDYQSAVIGTMTTESQGYRVLELPNSVVQSWITNPGNNFGLMLRDPVTNDRKIEITSSEGTANQRPYLELTLREACCGNGIDDDGDGDIDDADTDCGGYTTISTDTPITIPTGTPSSITSTITVSEYGTISDINVMALDILHNNIGDISVMLTSPTGTMVHLRNNGCASNDNLYLHFDQSGLPNSSTPCPPVDATNPYQAFGNLDAFNGEEVHGDWILTVDDDYAANGGTFLSWTLQYFLAASTEICDNGIDDDGDGLVDCDDPDCSILINSDMETPDPSFTYATNLEGNPAQKLLADSQELPEWVAGLAGSCMYYVNDTQDLVNNPEGDYFIWLPNAYDCFINTQGFTAAGMVDGQQYTISFNVAAWEISLNSNCDPDNGSATQGPGIVLLDFETHSYANVNVAKYQIPQSPSWANLNWQRIDYTFIYDDATDKQFGISNGNDIGLAVDNIILSESSCVPVVPEICGNNQDDDNDGIVDMDCPCVDNEVTGISQTNTGVTDPNNALGLADYDYADLRGSDVLTLDLGEIVEAGETIQIHITRGNYNGRVTIEGSLSQSSGYSGNIVWGNPFNGNTTYPATLNDGFFETIDYTVPAGGMRYIRFTRNAGWVWVDAVRGCVLIPENCTDNTDDNGNGLTDCDDPYCQSISFDNITVGSCINHPLMDVATLTAEVSWKNAPSNDDIEVHIYGQIEYISVSSNLTSPQTVNFTIPADGTGNNEITASWQNNTTLCPTTATYNAPSACSNDELDCKILYLCGDDKPEDGWAWDHGFIDYLVAVNAGTLLPVLTKPDGTGDGLYDANLPGPAITIDLEEYDLIIISPTTEGYIANGLITKLKNTSAGILNMNYLISDDLGLTANNAGYNFQSHLYTDNSTQEEIYNYPNDLTPWFSLVFTKGTYTAAADPYLWQGAGDQAAGIDGTFFVYDEDDPMPGITGDHGIRVFSGYHMNGFYANDENSGTFPTPAESYFNPATHLTLVGKSYFDQTIIAAGGPCAAVNSCALTNSFPGFPIDFENNNCGWIDYHLGNDLVLKENGDGTKSITGTINNAIDADFDACTNSPCGSNDEWVLNLTLSDKMDWATFQAAGGSANVHANCNANIADLDYWDISGTLVGTGCNSGRTLTINGPKAPYRLQIGYGANSGDATCSFGMSTWFDIVEGGTMLNADIYAFLEESCYGSFSEELSLVKIGDTIFEDTNHDGDQDAGENGIAGVIIELIDVAADTIVGLNTTDVNGKYLFEELPGNYRVHVIAENFLAGNPLENFVPTADPDGVFDNESETGTLLAKEENLDMDFGYHDLGTGWDFTCSDDTCVEIIGIGIKNNVPATLNFTDVGSIQHIIVEATYSEGSNRPEQVAFTSNEGVVEIVDQVFFDNDDDVFFQGFFDPTSSITLTQPNGGSTARAETFIAYIFRDCENTASSGDFVHRYLYNDSHTFSFSIPTAGVPRDIEIVVPLSEITNDTRIAQITATAGPAIKTITINSFNQGNSLNITPFTLLDVPGDVDEITIEVSSPGGGVGQSLYLSGAGSANIICPILTVDKRVDDTIFKLGETVTYTYVIYNSGSATITNINLTDDKLGNISLPQTSLVVGDSIVVTETYVIQASDFPGGITNVATVTGKAQGQDLTDSDTEHIDLIAIDLVKTVNPINTTIGATVTYTYEITNNGSAILELDLVDDKLGNITIADSTSQDLILLYDFSEGTGNVINDVSDYGSPIDLTFENSANHSWGTGEVTANIETRAVNSDLNTKIYNELTATNEITVAAWVTPANLTQNGPARIVSSSYGSANRNFTLGQEAGNFNVRLRTTTNGNNGLTVNLNGGTVTTSLTHVAFTRNAAGTAVLYVNGVAVDTEIIAGDFSNWENDFPFVLFNEVNATRTWLGGISNVAVYKSALSASEIQDNYNLGSFVNNGRVAPGQTIILTAEHVVTNADAPSPLVNIADVTGSPVNHPKEVTDQDTAEVYFPNPPEICGDNIDNDFDGLTDCDDPDCTTPSLTFNGTTTVCAGQQTTITAVGNEANYIYQWSHGLGTGQTKTITPPSNPNQNVTTTYSVTVTDAQGCTFVGTIDVTAESLPAATVSFSDEFCNQSNGFIIFTFNDHPNQTQLSFSIDGGSTYPYTSQDNNGTFAVNNLGAGSYDLWVRWGSGDCPVDLPDVTIGNTGGPSVNITGPTSICEGQPAQISALATGGTSPYLYTWDNGLGNGSSKTVFPTTTTTYTVTATDNKGCTDTDQISITVLPALDPSCSNCPNPADDDGDGVCESEDCDDNDPNIPAPQGTACDDGNPNTVNDEIQADECTCAGEFLPCAINFGVQINQPIYNDNGTSGNLSDDTFTFTVLISGNGSTWTADGQSGAYGTTATFGPYAVDASGVSFDVLDTDNPSCRENISVNIASCIYSGVCTCCE